MVGQPAFQGGSLEFCTVPPSGAVTLGGYGNAVTISSNVVMPGATFYQNGTVLLGNGGFTMTLATNTILSGAFMPGNTAGASGGGVYVDLEFRVRVIVVDAGGPWHDLL